MPHICSTTVCELINILRYHLSRTLNSELCWHESKIGYKHYLKCNANVPPVLVGYFMYFRIGIYQNGHLKQTRRGSQQKNTECRGRGFPPLWDICVAMERTYCFTTVCNETRRLLEGFLKVVFEPLILILFGAQLHKFTWSTTKRIQSSFRAVVEKSCNKENSTKRRDSVVFNTKASQWNQYSAVAVFHDIHLYSLARLNKRQACGYNGIDCTFLVF